MATEDAENSSSAITPLSLVSTVGFAVLIFSLISIPVLPVLPPLQSYPFEMAAVLRGAEVLGVVIAFGCGIRFAARFAAHVPTLFIVAAILAFVGIISSIIAAVSGSSHLVVDAVCWVFSGAGTGLFAVCWAVVLCLVSRRVSLRIVVFGTVLGTLIFVAVSLHGGYEVFVAVEYLVLAVVGAASGLYAMHCVLQDVDEEDAVALSQGRIPLASIPAALTSFANGSIFGFATLYVCHMGIVPGVVIIASGVVGSIAAAVWILAAKPEGSQFDAVMRLSTPLVVIGILVLPFVDDAARIACGALIVVALSFCMAAFWIRIPQISAENGYPAIRWFSYRQALDWGGFLVGGALAGMVLFVAGDSEVACIASCIGQAVIVVIFYSMAGAEKNPVSGGAEAIDAESDASQPTMELPDEAKAVLRFMACCDEIADETGLTRREREVFVLLSKGRNAKAIQEKLFISESTAKTHIYNIYRKLQVSTQQELIDLVEASVEDEA